SQPCIQDSLEVSITKISTQQNSFVELKNSLGVIMIKISTEQIANKVTPSQPWLGVIITEISAKQITNKVTL
ncbi:4297_t:CDS:2, partial [Dentiscutata erythropus]